MKDDNSQQKIDFFNSLKDNPFQYIISKSWKYAEHGKKRYITFILMSFFANILMLFNPYAMGQVFNALQTGGADIMSHVAFWLGALVIIKSIFWLFHGPSRVIERNIAFDVRGNFINQAYKKLRLLPLKWHQDHHSGNTINRIRKAGEALYDFTGQYFQYIWSIVHLFGPVFILFYLSWPVAVVALFLNIMTLTALYSFDRVIMRWLDRENEKEHVFSATFFDYVANFTTIISLRLGRRTQKELYKRYGEIKPSFQPHVRLNEWKYFILNMAAIIMVALVLLVYIWNELQQNGIVMIGTAVAIYRYLEMFRQSFFGFAGIYQRILKNYTDLRSAEYIMQAENSQFSDKAVDEIDLAHWSKIEINKLNFVHNKNGLLAVDILDFTIEQNQRIALVGESGAGKSTFMALIRGLYEPQTVMMTFDGMQYDALNSLYDKTTLIPQDPEIFENTIYYNITVGVDYEESAIQEALRISRFDRVLKRLPHGLDTDVREKGVSLSGGEKQRLALARGILAASNSSIILMDEPTSSVDAQNEIHIYENVFNHFEGRAVISSIHRLHLLNQFDQVVVMDHGKIVQMGSFEDLKKQPGLFQTLWDKYQQSLGKNA